MKKVICLVMAFLILGALLCACGEATNDPNKLIGKTIEEIHEELGQPLQTYHSEGRQVEREVYTGTGGKVWVLIYDAGQKVTSVETGNYG